jgi:glucose/arabinose dehydrogenase
MKKIIALLIVCNLGFSCKTENEIIKDETENQNNPNPITNQEKDPKIENQIVVNNRGIIWGFDFMPNGNIIFTEKSGKMGIFSEGKITELGGLPNDIHSNGQGGLLDVCLHPNFKSNGWIYATYSSASGSHGVLNLMRFKINGSTLGNIEKIFKTSANNTSKNHYGSRIAFDKEGFLFLSVGEGGPGSEGGENSFNKNAQKLNEAWGKIHRLTDDGKVPNDNPILPGNTAPSSIYSYGHRNPQGLTLNISTGDIWSNEHGPRGGDELNKIEKGKNYGWPLVSNGVNYSGSTISSSPNRTGIEGPKFQWTPSIGTSGLAYISSEKYGLWKGSFLSGGLAGRHLSRTKFSSDGRATESKILQSIGRVRDVKQSPDGFIYVSVEGPGRIIKLVPSF